MSEKQVGPVESTEALVDVKLGLSTEDVINAAVRPVEKALSDRKKKISKDLKANAAAMLAFTQLATQRARKIALADYAEVTPPGYVAGDINAVNASCRLDAVLVEGEKQDVHFLCVSGLALVLQDKESDRQPATIRLGAIEYKFTDEQQAEYDGLVAQRKQLTEDGAAVLAEQELLPEVRRDAQYNLVKSALTGTASGKKVLGVLQDMAGVVPALPPGDDAAE